MKYSLLSLVLILCRICSLYGSCPSNEYVYCAREDGICNVPGSITEGYISFGVDGRYTLVPFTNNNGGALNIECDNDFGDSFPGKTKYCCYTEADIDFDITSFSDYLAEGDNHWFGFDTDYHSMSYGVNDQYVYRVVSGANGWCKNAFFNDVWLFVGKHCKKSSDYPPMLDTTEWTLCANEGNDCTGLDTSSSHWIKYGADSSFYYRLVVSSQDGRIYCVNDLFDDPKPGTPKYCWISEPQYTFSSGYGYWVRIPSCGGCSSNEYSKTIGIEELTSNEITDTWQVSLTASLSNDYQFGSVELSTTVATSVANTLTNALTVSTTLTTTYVCNKDSVYQWMTDVTENDGINVKAFTISSEDFWCIDSGLTPQCAPGYCQDSNCQQCSY